MNNVLVTGRTHLVFMPMVSNDVCISEPVDEPVQILEELPQGYVKVGFFPLSLRETFQWPWAKGVCTPVMRKIS